MNEYKTLDELWEEADKKFPFFVSTKDDIFKRIRKVSGKTTTDTTDYDPNLYWVDGRLICRRDALKKMWKKEVN